LEVVSAAAREASVGGGEDGDGEVVVVVGVDSAKGFANCLFLNLPRFGSSSLDLLSFELRDTLAFPLSLLELGSTMILLWELFDRYRGCADDGF
jgi:hypothetical protein